MPAVPIYIQEKIHPQALIEELRLRPEREKRGNAQVAAAAPELPSPSTDPDKTVAAVTRSANLDTRGIGRVKRLPGTVAEARQAFDKLKTLTGLEPKLYSEGQASEAIVKATKSPQVLVLATDSESQGLRDRLLGPPLC